MERILLGRCHIQAREVTREAFRPGRFCRRALEPWSQGFVKCGQCFCVCAHVCCSLGWDKAGLERGRWTGLKAHEGRGADK